MKGPWTVIEFNTRTIRVCRSAWRRGERVITHCFAFESQEIGGQLKRHRPNLGFVTLALPRHEAALRFSRLPSRNEQEIRSMVAMVVPRDTIFDCRVVSHDPQGYSLVSSWMFGRQRLARYLEILQGVGIVPDRVTLNTQG